MSKIKEGLARLKIKASPEKLDKLNAYVVLMQKWNRIYNLTAVNSADDIKILHILDSASVMPFIEGSKILDIGTGAGLPGLVLAILNENLQLTLLDSNNKKVRFLRQCKLELGLDNIHPVQARLENFAPAYKFDSIVARAFGSFDDFVDNCIRLVKAEGILVAMKGKWQEATKYEVQVEEILVPFLAATRHIIVYRV